MVRFDIVLLGQSQVYRPGSVVEGYVTLELSSPQNVKGVSIVISGKARVKWELMTEFWDPCDTEIVLRENSSRLLGNGRDPQRLTSGRHELPFAFQLPTGLPSSYYNKVNPSCSPLFSKKRKGYIRYSLTATMFRSWKANLHASTVIQVKDIVNTNIPQLSTPLSAQSQSREGSYFCCGSGPITMTVETDRGGYCPGELIAFTVKVENNGNRRIIGVQANLRQKIDYYAKRKSHHESQSVETIWGPGTGPCGEINWSDGAFLIPETTPTISNCRIINISYVLKVQILVAFAKSLSAEIPIVIGTETFQREQPTWDTANPYQAPATNPEFQSVQVQQPGTSTLQPFAIPGPPPINPDFASFPRQPTVATDNYQIPNINTEGTYPPLNTGGDQEMGETAFAPVSNLVTNYTSDQPPSYDSIFN